MPTKNKTSTELPHIDNGFFRLTDAQAASFSRSGKCPRSGYQNKSLPFRTLAEKGVTLTGRKGVIDWPTNSGAYQDGDGPFGWIQSTPYSCRTDAPARGWVYALMVHFSA